MTEPASAPVPEAWMPSLPRTIVPPRSPFQMPPTGAPMMSPFAIAAAPAAPPKKKKRRVLPAVLMLLTVGGVGVGGAVFGPQLIEKLTSISETAADATTPSTDAGSATLPVVSTAPIAVRTATVVTSGTVFSGDPAASVEITTDFDTGLTRALVTRAGGTTIEILTYADSAFVRRAESPQWYHTNVGTFVVSSELARTRWIVTLDRLAPAAAKPYITVSSAVRDTIGELDVTRVDLTIDTAAMFAASPKQFEAWATDLGMALTPRLLDLRLWVDSSGLVRRSEGLIADDAEVELTSVSADAFTPTYPGVESWRELDAAALLALGI